MSADCVVCGSEAAVSDACPHCGAPCCRTHRPPDVHDCPGTDAGTTTGWRLDLDSGVRQTDDRPGSMFQPGLGLALGALLVVAVALGAAAYAGPLGDGALDSATVEFHIEERTDDERAAAAVGETAHDPELAAVARQHSRDMRDRGFVNHTNPDGETPTDRVRAAGLDCRPGENIYQTPWGTLASSERALADHAVDAWMDSTGHRETLLRERYTRQGVGVAIGDGGVYITQLFC